MTKAMSKAQKRRSKRGRPRKEGVMREPNGRASRAKNPPAKVAIENRMKRYGLTREQATDPKAETHIGRLSLKGKYDGLSEDQYDAAQKFLALRNDYRRSLLSPGAYYEAKGVKMPDDDLTDYITWVKRINKHYKEAMHAIEEAQFDNSQENLFAALQYVIIGDMDLPHLLGPTRMVLNALCRHFNRHKQLRAPRRAANITLAGFRHQSLDNKVEDLEQITYPQPPIADAPYLT